MSAAANSMKLLHEEDRKVIWAAWNQRAKYADIPVFYTWDWLDNQLPTFHVILRWMQPTLYTIKGIICLLLRRQTDFLCVDSMIEIATYDIYSPASWEYGGDGWTSFVVDSGLFRGWRYDIFDDSSV
jgi:hypothetical protein